MPRATMDPDEFIGMTKKDNDSFALVDLDDMYPTDNFKKEAASTILVNDERILPEELPHVVEEEDEPEEHDMVAELPTKKRK